MFLIILVIGLGLLIYGIFNISVRIKFIPMSKVITGTVIDMRKTHIRKGGTAYYPIIEYYNPETDRVESFEHEIGSGRTRYNIGDSLELRYYNGDRKIVLINSWSGIWGAPIAFIIAGVIFTAFGLLMRLI